MTEQSIETWSTFRARISSLPIEEQESIDWAYQIAKAAHRGTVRRDGSGRYFEHPRNVAIIILDECQVAKPAVIKAALLHDVPEDCAIFGSSLRYPYSVWRSIVHSRIARMFDEECADLVIDLTRPPIDHQEISCEAESEALYLENLKRSKPGAKIVKMADRLHNLRTYVAKSPEGVARKISETKSRYFPAFNDPIAKYEWQRKYLLEMMENQFVLLAKHNAS